MAVSEESRHHLYQRLEEVPGPEEAATLMEHLPPVGWADVATKRDIDDLRIATKRDIDGLHREIEELGGSTRREIDQLRSSTERKFDCLDERVGRIEAGLTHLGDRLALTTDSLHQDIRATMLAMMGTMVVLVSAVVALVKL